MNGILLIFGAILIVAILSSSLFLFWNYSSKKREILLLFTEIRKEYDKVECLLSYLGELPPVPQQTEKAITPNKKNLESFLLILKNLEQELERIVTPLEGCKDLLGKCRSLSDDVTIPIFSENT